MAGKQNFTIEQNAVFRKRMRYMTRARRGVVLTGYTAILQARLAEDDANPVISLTTENGGITIEANGTITLFMSLEQVKALTFKTANYDLILIAPNGEPRRLLEGRFAVSAGSTRL